MHFAMEATVGKCAEIHGSVGNATLVPTAWQPQDAESLVRPFLESFRGMVFVADDLASQEMFDNILLTLFGCLEQLADENAEWAASSGNVEDDCKAVALGMLYFRSLNIKYIRRQYLVTITHNQHATTLNVI